MALIIPLSVSVSVSLSLSLCCSLSLALSARLTAWRSYCGPDHPLNIIMIRSNMIDPGMIRYNMINHLPRFLCAQAEAALLSTLPPEQYLMQARRVLHHIKVPTQHGKAGVSHLRISKRIRCLSRFKALLFTL